MINSVIDTGLRHSPFPELLKEAISKKDPDSLDKQVGKVITDKKVREAFKNWKEGHQDFVQGSPLMRKISNQIDKFEKNNQMTKDWGFAELKQTGFLAIEDRKDDKVEEKTEPNSFYNEIETTDIFKNPNYKFNADQWSILKEYHEVGYFSDLEYSTLSVKKQAKEEQKQNQVFIRKDEIAEGLLNESKFLKTLFANHFKETNLEGFYLDTTHIEHSVEIFQLINSWAKADKKTWKNKEFTWDNISFRDDQFEGMIKMANFLEIPALQNFLDQHLVACLIELRWKIITPEEHYLAWIPRHVTNLLKIEERKDYSEKSVEENEKIYKEALEWLKTADDFNLNATKTFLVDLFAVGLFKDKEKKPTLYKNIFAELSEKMQMDINDKLAWYKNRKSCGIWNGESQESKFDSTIPRKKFDAAQLD